MKLKQIIIKTTILFFLLFYSFGCKSQNSDKTEIIQAKSKKNMNYNKLNKEEERILHHKGTEIAFTGIYSDFFEPGIYSCKQCNSALYTSDAKFHSGCGWPSFDQEIKGAVTRVLDNDGRRLEIICSNCKGHLGHVFEGEGFTSKNTRHCVNSLSMIFSPSTPSEKTELETAIFAGGCFWGVEYYFQHEQGVISTQVGYIGGHTLNPTYKEVCSKKTGHIEAMEIRFDPSKVSFEDLAKLFFEIHDATQNNGQGNDIGPQYLSRIFYNSKTQLEISEQLIQALTNKGYSIATKLEQASTFWPAETYHQQYYEKSGGTPYCHSRKKIF